MRVFRVLAMALALAGSVACGHLPSDAALDAALANRAQLVPGKTTEAEFLALYPSAAPDDGTIGIVDSDSIMKDGYSSRTYWVGYAWTSRGYPQTQRLFAATFVNEILDSVYRP